jgi:hypothetical protein
MSDEIDRSVATFSEPRPHASVSVASRDSDTGVRLSFLQTVSPFSW